MNKKSIDLSVRRHGVRPGRKNPFAKTKAGASVILTDFQLRLLKDRAPVRIASAPTGAGKTFVFELAPLIGKNVLFIVPTRRLAQNLEASVRMVMVDNGWDDDEIERRLAVWTSDATERLKASGMTSGEIRRQRVRHLRGFDGFREQGTFIIATPESVGQLLLNPPRLSGGQSVMSLTDLLARDHIVFDEFHLIEARGFGLAAALCRVASGLSIRPHITFLSATPIDIIGVLNAFDIPETEISTFGEHAESWRSGEEPSDARIIHGDVGITAGRYSDVVAACDGERERIATTLGDGRSVVVILDSVARLKARRSDLSKIFQRHGVGPADILVINSIDDAHHAFQDDCGSGGRSLDPKKARVILATSSVEIGVTFNASLLIMDPGHDSCSFIQRVGRVSRGDLPGHVTVTGPAPMLRKYRRPAGSEPDSLIETDVNEFIGNVLRDITHKFSTRDAGFSGSDLQTYRTMPNRAVWCACLFWCALRRVWSVYPGERATLRDFQPRKVGAMEAKLARFEKSEFDKPKEWVKAFIREAVRFRDIEPRLRVRYGERIDLVPESMVGRYRELSGSPILEDEEGFFISLQRPLESILKAGDTRPYQSTVQPLLPLDGIVLPAIPRRSAAKLFANAMEGTTRHPFGEEGDRLCENAANLVRMTGVVPLDELDEEDVTAAHQGTGVV